MKFGSKEISELSNEELINANKQCLDLLTRRNEASKHEKFNKMEFPPPNQVFVDMHNAIKEELKNRNLVS